MRVELKIVTPELIDKPKKTFKSAPPIAFNRLIFLILE